MKKLIVLLVAVVMSLLLVTPVRADLSAWLLSDNDVVGARLGLVHENIEVGGLSYWSYDSEVAPQTFGAYGIYHFPDLIDVNMPLSLPFLPEKLKGGPYVGMQIGANCDKEKRDFIGPIAGVDLGGFGFEYQYRSYSDALGEQLNDEHAALVFIRIQF